VTAGPRPSLIVAGTLWAASLALIVSAFVFTLANGEAGTRTSYGVSAIEAVFVLLLLTFPTVGAILAALRPSSPIGWILALGGLFLAVSQFANSYAAYTLLVRPGALPGGLLMAWIASTWAWLVGYGFLMSLFLFFPSGRLASRLARPVLGLLIAGVAAATIGYTFRPGRFDLPFAFVDNPFGATGGAGDLMSVLAFAGLLLSAAASVGAVAVFLRHVRRAQGEERQRLKWLGYVPLLFVLAIPALLVIAVVAGPQSLEVAVPAAFSGVFVAIPIAIGIAILRYRLYDIDLLINRTLVYGATSAAIAATFFAGIVALQTVLRPVTAGSELAVAASTLVSFAFFQPIRRRIQDTVDRRFDRSRYDAARTLDRFADRLRDEVDLGALEVELISAVERTMAPAHASVWLRGGASAPVTISRRPGDSKEVR
jgi:hypothetical protein